MPTQYLSDGAYFAFKPETTPGTAVIPTIFTPLVSEEVKTDVSHSADRRMKGNSWKANDLLRGNRMHEGPITVLGDPDVLGHFLNMHMVKGSTTGDANGYSHPFAVGNGDAYTVEFKKGLYAQRYFGVKSDELKLDFDDGQLQIECKIKAMGQFSVASLGAALSGSVTSLILDDNYDINPNRGLLVGDILCLVKDDASTVDLTLTSVDADGITVGFSSASITAAVGNRIYLKPLTVSQPTLQDPLMFGNMLVGFGADGSAAATAAAARTTDTKVYDMSIILKSNLFSKNGSSRMDPVQIIPRTQEGQIKLTQLFESTAQRQKFLERTKQAICIKAYGKYIKSDFTTRELATFTFYNVKLLTHENPLEVGELIPDDEEFEVLYSDSDAKAMDVTLVNRTAGTVM